jgi:hypothetical protein
MLPMTGGTTLEHPRVIEGTMFRKLSRVIIVGDLVALVAVTVSVTARAGEPRTTTQQARQALPFPEENLFQRKPGRLIILSDQRISDGRTLQDEAKRNFQRAEARAMATATGWRQRADLGAGAADGTGGEGSGQGQGDRTSDTDDQASAERD